MTTTELRRRWPEWVPYAAAFWSLLYGLVGLYWTAGGSGFPFGASDPDAHDMGSFFAGIREASGAPVIAFLGLGGAAVALAMARSQRHRRSLPVIAWVLGAGLILLVPDVRILQNFAYAFFLYFGKVKWPVANQVLCMVGGLAWGATALAYRRRTLRTCTACGRVGGSRWASPAAAGRWGRWAAYVSAVAALPYPVDRLILAAGIPLGLTPTDGQEPVSLALVMTLFAGLGIGGAVLTIGLVRPWGEVFPRWIPRLRGKRVPLWVAVVPGAWVAAILTVAGLRMSQAVIGGHGGAAPLWQQVTVSISWTTWGSMLGVATLAYYLRRRSVCGQCG